jgi:ssDNA-binding Zn-finger/Zn-ribbon topoisomerase 1
MGLDIAADRKEKALAKQKTIKKAAAKQAKTNKRKAQHKKFKAGLDGLKEGYKNHGSHVCTQCGKQANPKVITKGNIFFEILLWICFLLPGVLYSIWRHASRIKGCPDCKTQTMVKKDSPIGKRFLA